MTKEQVELEDIIKNFKKFCFISIIKDFQNNNYISADTELAKNLINI